MHISHTTGSQAYHQQLAVGGLRDLDDGAVQGGHLGGEVHGEYVRGRELAESVAD